MRPYYSLPAYKNLVIPLFSPRARRTGGWRVRWSIKYKGSIIDHQDRVDDYKERFATNDERCASGDDRCVTNPEVPKYLYYPSTWRHDLSVSYTWEMNGDMSTRFYGGVKNVFDDRAPEDRRI